MVSPLAYWLSVGVAVALCAAVCFAARRRPGGWTVWVRRALALVLAAVAITFVLTPIVEGTWTARASLPVDLCDAAVVIAAVACWWPHLHLAVELTYFWGLAGTLQAVTTPDLNVSFPHLAFWEFVSAISASCSPRCSSSSDYASSRAAVRCCASSRSRSPTQQRSG